MVGQFVMRGTLEQIYGKYREAYLNKLYYGLRLQRYSRFNTIFEIVIAVGSTSSGVSGWALWSDEQGRKIWAFIAGAATLAAIVKPVLGIAGRIESYSKSLVGYNSVYLSLKDLVDRISRQQNITDDMLREFEGASERYRELGIQEADAIPSKKLVKKLFNEVNAAIPPETLWVPQ